MHSVERCLEMGMLGLPMEMQGCVTLHGWPQHLVTTGTVLGY